MAGIYFTRDGKGLMGISGGKSFTAIDAWQQILANPTVQGLTDEERANISDSYLTSKSHTISVRKVFGTTNEFQVFDRADKIVKNIRNIGEARLPTGSPMVVSKLRFRVAELAGITEADVAVGNYQSLHVNAIHAALKNGTFRLKVGNKTLFDDAPLSSFDTKGRVDIAEGTYELEAYFLIPSQTVIEFTVSLGSIAGLTVNTAVELQMVGAMLSNV